MADDSERDPPVLFRASSLSAKRKREDSLSGRSSSSSSAAVSSVSENETYTNRHAASWAPSPPPPSAILSSSSRRKRFRYTAITSAPTPAAQSSNLFADRTSSTSPSGSPSPPPEPGLPGLSKKAHSHSSRHTEKKTARGIGRKAAEAKKEREERWQKWCEMHRWDSSDDPGYKQQIGSKEVHRSEAMSYFRLKDYEIDALPYVTYDDESFPSTPGRSYTLANLHALVSRKHAFLSGLDERLDPRAQEVEFLKRGWQLFRTDMKKYEERLQAKGRSRKALVFSVIFATRPPYTDTRSEKVKSRPTGSWTSRVFEDGLYIGRWLNFQCDPDTDEYGDFHKGVERFRPKNADWVWG